MPKQQIFFEFLGQCFNFRSNLPEEEIREVLALLEERKREIERVKNVPAYKLAVWLLFQLAYEYLKVKKEKEELESSLRAQNRRLKEFLEKEVSTLGCS